MFNLSWLKALYHKVFPISDKNNKSTKVRWSSGDERLDQFIEKLELLDSPTEHPMFYEYYYCGKCSFRHKFNHALTGTYNGVECYWCGNDMLWLYSLRLREQDLIIDPDTKEPVQTVERLFEVRKQTGTFYNIFPRKFKRVNS